MKPMLLLTLALVVVALAPSHASALDAALPTCPSEEDGYLTYPPDYVRVGRSFKVSVKGADNDTVPSHLMVQVGDQTIPLSPDEDWNAAAILAAPKKRGSLRIVFTWDQDIGTPTACHGIDTYTVPVIPAKGRVGNPGVGRMTGSYRVRYSRTGEKRTIARWSVAPGCSFFGCTARFKSTRGYHGLLKLRDGHYKFSPPSYTSGYCDITSLITGQKTRIKPLAHVTERVDIKPTKVVRGLVRRFTGTQVIHYVSTTRADNAGCGEVDAERRYKIVGVRR